MPLVPTLGLGVPLALPEQAVVHQEGIGGAVGVVDDLDAAGVGQDSARLARGLQRGRGALLRICGQYGRFCRCFVPTEWGGAQG